MGAFCFCPGYVSWEVPDMAEAGKSRQSGTGRRSAAAVRPAAGCGTRAASLVSGSAGRGGDTRCFNWYDVDVADDELTAALERLEEVERALLDIVEGSDSEVVTAWLGPQFPRLRMARQALLNVQDILSGGGA